MPLGRFPVQPVIDRLKAMVPALKLVEPVADLGTALNQKPAAFPAAFVVTARAGRPPAGMSGGVLRQGVNAAIQVVLFVQNFSRAETGAAAAAQMDALTEAVDTALLNWAPSADYHTLSLGRGADAPYAGTGMLVRQETYQSEYRIQATRGVA